MITVMFVTKQDIVKAKNRLNTVHNIFKKSCEQEAAIDFANCLKEQLKQGTAYDFLKACEVAADDLLDPEKVPEVYDRFTVGIMKDLASVFAEELFGKSFAEEVRQFADVRELV